MERGQWLGTTREREREREDKDGGMEKVTMTNSDPCWEVLFVLCALVGHLLPSALSLQR